MLLESLLPYRKFFVFWSVLLAIAPATQAFLILADEPEIWKFYYFFIGIAGLGSVIIWFIEKPIPLPAFHLWWWMLSMVCFLFFTLILISISVPYKKVMPWFLLVFAFWAIFNAWAFQVKRMAWASLFIFIMFVLSLFSNFATQLLSISISVVLTGLIPSLNLFSKTRTMSI
jgi:hypothetical protein